MSNAPQLLINQITAYFSPLITAKGSDYFQRHQVPNAAGVKILFNERQIEGNHETSNKTTAPTTFKKNIDFGLICRWNRSQTSLGINVLQVQTEDRRLARKTAVAWLMGGLHWATAQPLTEVSFVHVNMFVWLKVKFSNTCKMIQALSCPPNWHFSINFQSIGPSAFLDIKISIWKSKSKIFTWGQNYSKMS